MKTAKLIHAFIITLVLISSSNIQAAMLESLAIFSELAEKQAIDETQLLSISSNMFTLEYDSQVSVFFIDEGAGYKNSFGWYDATTDPRNSTNRTIIWDNASGTGEGLAGGGSLNLGDRVDLGFFAAGSQLGFFLTANGYYTGSSGNTFYTDDSYNADGLMHVLAGVSPDDGIIALGFEDIYGGGDMDFNDLLVAVDIGIANTVALGHNNIPEPGVISLLLLGLSYLVFFYWKNIRKNRLMRKIIMSMTVKI